MERPDLATRWVVLGLTSVLMMGLYFCYDNPAALKAPIQDSLHLTDTQYNLFYSVYSFPNILLPLFGGLLVDRFGTRATLIVFTSCIGLGQGVFALGVTTQSYMGAILGRILYGLGGESLSVVQSTIVAVWFKGKEMALAMGFGLTIARLGSVVNDWVCPEIYNAGIPFFFGKHEAASALWVGFSITLLSFACAVALVVLEYRVDRVLHSHRPKLQAVAEPLLAPTPLGEEVLSEKMSFSDIKLFPALFWLLAFSCLVTYATVLPFNNVAAGVIMSKWAFSLAKADRLMSIPYFMSSMTSPFLGAFIDVFGCRAVMLAFGAAALTGVHLTLGLTMVPAYMPLIVLGLAYSVYAAAVWPSVALVVDERSLGTAFGLVMAIQNGGLSTMPIFVGRIRDATGNYLAVELFFALIGAVGVVLGVAINLLDRRSGGVLNRSTSRARHQPAEGVTPVIVC